MSTSINRPCIVCEAVSGHSLHYPSELMFGTGETFEYLECGACGCLQIVDIPADLARHYPANAYYSFTAPSDKKYPNWVLALRRYRTRYFLGERTALGSVIACFSKESEHFSWFRDAGIGLDSSIVDIGCGAGKLLLKLQREGFSNLLGLDPFLEKDIDYKNGVRILKRNLGEIEQQFDLVMLNHAFEHIPDTVATLMRLKRLLKTKGALLLRIPVADSYAKRRYGVYWHAWDPPRHLYLHTLRSMHVLAKRCGLRVDAVSHDSRHSQFSTSELYMRGLPQSEHAKYYPSGTGRGAFSERDWEFFKCKAEELNRLRDGDTACFILRLDQE